MVYCGLRDTSFLVTRSRFQTFQLAPSVSQKTVKDAIDLGSRTSPRIAANYRPKPVAASSLSVSLAAAEQQQQQQHQQHQSEHLNSFEDLVQQSSTPILVDFYAPWCGPCQLMSKVVSAISQEMQGDLRVMKINADSYPKLANKYRVQALPTCLLFRDGKLIDRVDGFMPEPGFGRRIRFYVARLDKKFGRR